MKLFRRTGMACLSAYLLGIGFPAHAVDEVDDAIGVIARVGPGASGSSDARSASDQLARHGVEILPRLLHAMDTPNIVAANWYRSAFEPIVAREFAKSDPQFPKAALLEFARDSPRQGRARRLALSLLERIDPQVRAELLPGWLNDVEFRREAVDHAMSLGDKARDEKAVESARELYDRAFRHARDSDQVLQAVAKLSQIGTEVDPVAQLGLLTRWRLIGPFPAPGLSGFRTEFPPEMQQDFDGEYVGVDGQKVRWKLHHTLDRLGEVNLIALLGAVKESVGYAYTEIESPRKQQVQMRCSADDNLTVWLNGEKCLAREQWLNGTRLDRFVTRVDLEQGTNRILVKVCQGPQHVNPEVPNNWTFQMRLCDASEGAAEFRNLLPLPE